MNVRRRYARVSLEMSYLVLVVALMAAGAAAQQVNRDELTREDLRRPVEATVGDVGPLATSFRVLEPGLRQPTGFDTVLPGPDAKLMRASGGLYAVFPRSDYATTKRGVVALVPPSTTFHIGTPDLEADIAAQDAAEEAMRIRTAQLLNTRIIMTGHNHQAGAVPVGRVAPPMRRWWERGSAPYSDAPATQPHRDPSPKPRRIEAVMTIANDESYRTQRLRRLLTEPNS